MGRMGSGFDILTIFRERDGWCRERESNPHGREGSTDFECKPQRSKFNNFKCLGVQDAAKHTIS